MGIKASKQKRYFEMNEFNWEQISRRDACATVNYRCIWGGRERLNKDKQIGYLICFEKIVLGCEVQ